MTASSSPPTSRGVPLGPSGCNLTGTSSRGLLIWVSSTSFQSKMPKDTYSTDRPRSRYSSVALRIRLRRTGPSSESRRGLCRNRPEVPLGAGGRLAGRDAGSPADAVSGWSPRNSWGRPDSTRARMSSGDGESSSREEVLGALNLIKRLARVRPIRPSRHVFRAA